MQRLSRYVEVSGKATRTVSTFSGDGEAVHEKPQIPVLPDVPAAQEEVNHVGMSERLNRSTRMGFTLTLICTPQDAVQWQMILEDQQGHVRHFETPLALLEWLEQAVVPPPDTRKDLP